MKPLTECLWILAQKLHQEGRATDAWIIRQAIAKLDPDRWKQLQDQLVATGKANVPA